MQLTILTALHKAIGLVGTTIQKVTELTKPQFKFFVWLIKRWWMLPVRYNFQTLSRYGVTRTELCGSSLPGQCPL
jgi:hypothetical protein